jgi:hypothetical protein
MNLKTIRPRHNEDFKTVLLSNEISPPEELYNKSETLKQRYKEISEENLDIIKSIHAILVNCSNLTQQQKGDYCKSERYFMKLYLKKFVGTNSF